MVKNHKDMNSGQEENEYLDWLKAEVEQACGCPAYYLRTETVHECIEGNTIWLGQIEVFGLIGHPEAKQCFAWGHEHATSSRTGRIVTILGIVPAISSENAVRIQLVKDLRSGTCS